MTISSEMAKLFGDPGDDYDSFEKCVICAIDSIDMLTVYLDGFIEDGCINQWDGELIKNIKCQKAVCRSLLYSLREWGLGLPSQLEGTKR